MCLADVVSATKADVMRAVEAQGGQASLEKIRIWLELPPTCFVRFYQPVIGQMVQNQEIVLMPDGKYALYQRV